MYYNVSLYKYDHRSNEKGFVKDIIVKKGVFSSTEIYTNTRFPMINNTVEKDMDLVYNHDFLYVRSASFTDDRIVSLDDVERYFDSFDVEKFNEILQDDYYYSLKEQKLISKYLKSRSKGVGKNG